MQTRFARVFNALMPSIGRIEDISGGIPQHIGTGFVVGPNPMMTNRHVAEAFVRGTGRLRNQLSFIPGIESAIDFRRENELDPNDLSTSVRLTDVVMVHPYWDMALFRVDGLSAANRGLRLSVSGTGGSGRARRCGDRISRSWK
ncbi:MAG UNVERIFIED_CONTAM: hypothetical protein LVR18_25460 [Planctomycetaceae bacterium]